ncbi:ribosome-binding protein aMBF1 (putative translation factor) [Providencia alcalifaciens]|nr:ribosome-binding protein aMBF1 (putative translation factor) [Providencia alcalifaciens]
MAIQIIYNANGEPEYAVLPFAEYEKLISDDGEEWEEIPYTPTGREHVTYPNGVIKYMVEQDMSLLAAWRTYRGLSQLEVAEMLNTTQSTVSQWEASDKPQKRTREKLARIYECSQEQLIP